MDNQIDPAVGNWYQHLDDGRLFQVVAVDDEEELVEFQHFDGAMANLGSHRDRRTGGLDRPDRRGPTR